MHTQATFDGATYDPTKDQARLARQLTDVKLLMADAKWRTLAEIAASVDAPEASVSARLRDCRKERNGGHTVNRRRRAPGTFEYQLVIRENV
jgi:hypothetical protein